ncbi:hypothetical protein BJG93_24530 [Paraburkholderia sprentiae WSM5005]|uniref:Uncharacterized protein n=1 Tax=Paraburkholderia sprentiae WSM5005 TaxID=754502 RepID=A0A1I9YQP0_9BURK|nr:hypothetical protein [Paraburkholderia sprentiae]APA88518.1 hypothetical protein BJG93_24530 [Paraburkholderia sprentiae WSM5005]
MNADDSPYQRYSAELADRLAMRDHFRQMMEGELATGCWTWPCSPRQATDFLDMLDDDIGVLSEWIFYHDAQAAIRSGESLMLSQRAAIEVAQRFMTPPRDGDDLKNWRVSFPCLLPRPPSQQQRRSREKAIRICNAVCESIERRTAAHEEAPRKEAIREVAPHFHLGVRAVEKAYDENRQAVELMRQLARAYSGHQG